VAALNTRTDGWIAGLQMAALSLHKHPNAREFIAAFTGSNRYIFDYLLEEVLQKQPLAIQEFLLKTSILDRLCAPLCDFILERNDSQPVLAKLEQDNLFLLPLDEERRWYRYHHLFAQLLQVRMERSGSGSKALHARASLWLEAQGLHTDALNHALKAGDPQRASNLAEEHALSMLGQGHLGTLTSLLETLPEEIVNNRPWLCVAQGLPAVYAGRLEVAERCANRAEAQLESGTLTLSTAERAHIQGFVALIRSTAAGLNIDYENAERYANLALDLIPADDLAGRAMAYTMLGTCSRHEGKLLQAVAALETAG